MIRPEFSSIQAIKSSIETISLYDADGKLVANTGTFYKDVIPETTEDAITFSSLFKLERNAILVFQSLCIILIRHRLRDDVENALF